MVATLDRRPGELLGEGPRASREQPLLQIRPAIDDDAEAIAAIHNQGIAARSATFDTGVRTVEQTRVRIAAADAYPMLVAQQDGRVIGWAALSAYRARACYAGVAEFSIYLDASAHGRGIGKRLLQALIDAARERGMWKLLSRIFTFNLGSRALCRALGFREVGVYEKHAPLDGQWLDVVIVERLIVENIQQSGLPQGLAPDPVVQRSAGQEWRAPTLPMA